MRSASWPVLVFRWNVPRRIRTMASMPPRRSGRWYPAEADASVTAPGAAGEQPPRRPGVPLRTWAATPQPPTWARHTSARPAAPVLVDLRPDLDDCGNDDGNDEDCHGRGGPFRSPNRYRAGSAFSVSLRLGCATSVRLPVYSGTQAKPSRTVAAQPANIEGAGRAPAVAVRGVVPVCRSLLARSSPFHVVDDGLSAAWTGW